MTDRLREREALDISSAGETIHMKKCKKHGTHIWLFYGENCKLV